MRTGGVYIGKKNGIYIECEWCGKQIYRTVYQYKKREHHFCSNKCQALKRESETYEHRKCGFCGVDMYVRRSSTKQFCSTRCQNEWQRNRIGFENPKFEGGVLTCQWCGQDYVVGKYKLEHGSRFCSIECRREWYSKIWSQSDEWKTKSRKRAASLMASNNVCTQTRPQIIMNDILNALNISYTNEEPFVYYSVDNYLSEYNLIIEVMGDYWHCNPIRYDRPINDRQAEIISRDKAKHTFIFKRYGIEILYVWESDLLKSQEKCAALILEYIGRNGELQDYNSFNYNYEDNVLSMLQNPIIPFQFRKIAC